MLGLGKSPLSEIGQFEIIKEQVEEFLASQNEAKGVLVLAFAGLARPPAARARARQHVTFKKLLIPGQHIVFCSVGAAAKARFTHAVKRNADFAALEHVGNVAALRRIPHSLLHKCLGASQEPLAILEALTAWVEAPINNVHLC